MRKLESLADLEAVLAERERPVVLFKHSTRCPVSARALEEVEAFEKDQPARAVYAFLDLIAHRDVSSGVEDRLGVRHESPQAIVLEGGKVRAVMSHFGIRKGALGDALTSCRPGRA